MSYIPHFIHTHAIVIKAPSIGFYLASLLEFRCCLGMTPLLHFKHLQGLILKPLYAGTVSFRGWISWKRKAWGEICRNVMSWAEANTGTEDCPQPPLNVLWILSQDRFTPNSDNKQKHCRAHPSSSVQSLTGILLSRFFAHLHLPSVWFAAVPSEPPLLMWVYKHQDKLYRSNFFKMRHLYSALSWGSLPATQARDFFRSAGQAPSAGNYKSWFQAGFISILVKSLQPSRAFLFRLTCLLLTIR